MGEGAGGAAQSQRSAWRAGIMMKDLIPIVVALISASALLLGYVIQKKKEREFELNKVRQEIYMRLIKNILAKVVMLEDAFRKGIFTEITQDNEPEVLNKIAEELPDVEKNLNEDREIMAMMAVYATDEAIKACVQYYQENWAAMKKGSTARSTLGNLLSNVRRSIFIESSVTGRDIDILLTK
ncbi:MAG TPA: hypothetical protein VNP04_31900 [Alphaproteobacteria bacterium]|nr:hypothetical protein [Alphaproteobacteria bacterium]